VLEHWGIPILPGAAARLVQSRASTEGHQPQPITIWPGVREPRGCDSQRHAQCVEEADAGRVAAQPARSCQADRADELIRLDEELRDAHLSQAGSVYGSEYRARRCGLVSYDVPSPRVY